MRDIFEYIAHDNPEAAARVVEGVYDRAQVLTEFPRIGKSGSCFTDIIVSHTGSSRTTKSTFSVSSTALSISRVTKFSALFRQ